MADLHLVSSNSPNPIAHAIFIHGISGDPFNTWAADTRSGESWLHWLADDIENLCIWSVGYPAAISRVRGTALHINDRAQNILQRICADSRLSDGNIALIGHSMGGLLIKNMLQIADSVSRSTFEGGEAARSFLKRIQRIGFIATPHSGADAATWLDRGRILFWPSTAASCLVRNDGNLRALNEWYRTWVSNRPIAHLVLGESMPTYRVILIVPPDSANPGLNISPIYLDEDHFSICKPSHRNAETYIHIHKFLSLLASPASAVGHISTSADTEVVEKIVDAIEKGRERFSVMIVEHIQNSLEGRIPDSQRPIQLIDREIRDKQNRLRQLRFIETDEAHSFADAFGAELTSGPLALGTDAVRSAALAWCARVLSNVPHGNSTANYLSLAKKLGSGEEIKAAEALLLANSGDAIGALKLLAPLDTPFLRTAALISQSKSSTSDFFSWIKKTKIDIGNVDADGRLIYLQRLVANKSWSEALDYVQSIEEREFTDAPALQLMAAHTYLSSAVPVEFRDQQFQHFPIDAKSYPLSSTEDALRWRRSAWKLFDRSQIEFAFINKRLSKICSDFSLWLKLRDPEHGDEARRILEESLAEPENVLSRSLLAIQFDLDIDSSVLESEIARQEALGIAANSDLASACMACLRVQTTAEDSLAVLLRYKTMLISYFSKFEIVRMELSLNLKIGNRTHAESLFHELVLDGISEEEKNRITNELSQTENDVAQCIKQFRASDAIADLAHLVHLLEEKKEWQEVREYGHELFKRTGAMQDAERLAVALNTLNRFAELKEFLLASGVNLAHSVVLRSCWCSILYRDGEFERAKQEITLLRNEGAISNYTDQLAAIAVSSGRWGDLAQIANDEWEAREHRDTNQLISAARLSFIANSLHGLDLLRLAVSKADSDANVLAGAYFSAVSAGLEDSEEVGQWLSTALKLSGQAGPFKSMSLEDLKKSKPEWDQQANTIWRQLSTGDLPIFSAAHALNHSLIDLTLAAHIGNKHQQDVRQRYLIPSFSGSRRPEETSQVNNVAIDATALLTMGSLGLLDKFSQGVSKVFIPHTTLSWLFTERQKVTYHQPTKVKHASQLRDMLAVGKLQEFQPKGAPPTQLARDIGQDLAIFLTAALDDVEHLEKKSYVVRSAPVKRLGTLQQSVDVSQYELVLTSCTSIVEKLRAEGHLTTREDDRATAYLKNHEEVWPNEPHIESGSALYLDDLSVTYLHHIGVLEKLKNVFGNIYVSGHLVSETNALLSYANRSTEILEVIDSIRSFLERGIESKNIMVSPLPEYEVEGDDIARPFSSHPTMALMNSVAEIDAILVDDRFLNKLGNAIDKSGNSARILTTLDIIEMLNVRGKIVDADVKEVKMELRQAGHFGIDVSAQELCAYLDRTKIKDGSLIETAELRMVREYYLLIRMRSYLQIPAELPWYESFLWNFKAAIRLQWNGINSTEVATARSNWLFAQIDPRFWVQFVSVANSANNVADTMAMQMMLMVSICWEIPPPQRKQFKVWLDEHILIKYENMMPGLGERIHDRLKNHLAALVK